MFEEIVAMVKLKFKEQYFDPDIAIGPQWSSEKTYQMWLQLEKATTFEEVEAVLGILDISTRIQIGTYCEWCQTDQLLVESKAYPNTDYYGDEVIEYRTICLGCATKIVESLSKANVPPIRPG